MRPAVVLAVLAAAFPGCFLLPKPRLAPEQRFGNRPPAENAQEATIWTVTPAAPGQMYFYFDVPVSEVVPRVEPRTTAPGDSARVELLVKGSVPNDCYELESVTETRQARFVDLTLRMRRPQGVPCRTVIRTYRYYHMLRGVFAPGPYVFSANGASRPYEIRLRTMLPRPSSR
ncbi:MAG: hypothetical protein LCH53_10330 [Bacteroidetes bacterium]|nr:hypothetical protein [Bacteroidota bacterium]